MQFVADFYSNVEMKHKKILIFLLFLPFVYSINIPGGNIDFIDDFFTIARVICAFIIVFVFFFINDFFGNIFKS